MSKTVERRTATYHAGTDREIVIDFTPGNHRYKLNGEYAPSVTTMLNLLAIDALPWWGMKVGVEGTQELHLTGGASADSTTEDVIAALIKGKMTVNHVRDEAGTRGDLAHDQMRRYAELGEVPTLTDVPDKWHGFTQALAAFLIDARPEFIDSELLVASPTHGFTGTLDGRVLFDGERDLVTDWWEDPEVGLIERRELFDAGLYMIDAKTGETPRTKPGRGVYTSHHLQLTMYEHAAVECGKSPTDEQLVVNLHSTGRYKVTRNVATMEDAAPFIPLYHAVKRVEKSMREAAKATA